MTFEKFFEANKQHEEFVKIIQNVIFGDMKTENKYINSQDVPSEIVNWFESQLFEQRKQFMNQMLEQIDEIDENILELQKDWSKFYWTKFKSFIGYCWEKIFRQSNELSRLYKLTTEMKEGILLMIYYQECSICLELITEIVNHTPRACITKFTRKNICTSCGI